MGLVGKRNAAAHLALVVMLACCMASRARAEPPPEQSNEPDDAVHLEHAVDVLLQVIERGPGRPWKLRLENTSEDPIRLVADPRLLWFEAKVSGKKGTTTCRLPSPLFPSHASRRSLVILAPGKRVTRRFDPRFYCFSEGTQEILVPGTELMPHYGWPSETKTIWKQGKRIEEKLPDEPPFIARSTHPDSEAEPLKNIEGAPVTLDERYSKWANPPKHEVTDRPVLELIKGSDARTDRDVTVTIRIENPTDRPMTLFFRRELMSFKVLGPEGMTRCLPGPDDRKPDRQAFMNLWPGRKVTIVSRLVELCPRDTFARPGFYLVRAKLRATERGRQFGLHAWTGRLRSHHAVPVRVRSGDVQFRVRYFRAPPRGQPAPSAARPVGGSAAPEPAAPQPGGNDGPPGGGGADPPGGNAPPPGGNAPPPPPDQ